MSNYRKYHAGYDPVDRNKLYLLLLAKCCRIIYNFVGDNMKVKNDFVLKKIAGSYVAVPVRSRAVDFSGIVKLSESGAFLWDILKDGAERQDLIDALTGEYAVDEQTAGRDVDRFVEKLKEADLLE